MQIYTMAMKRYLTMLMVTWLIICMKVLNTLINTITPQSTLALSMARMICLCTTTSIIMTTGAMPRLLPLAKRKRASHRDRPKNKRARCTKKP